MCGGGWAWRCGISSLKLVEVLIDLKIEINQKSGTEWRLPSIDELASLGVKGCGNPSINVNVFPNAMVNNYWAKDESPHTGFRCGMYTFSGATSCRLFDNLERPFFMVRSPK